MWVHIFPFLTRLLLSVRAFLDILCGVITVQWPSRRATQAEIWNVLHFAGLAQNPRQAEGMVKAGWVYKNGNPIRSKKSTVQVGSTFTLEVRYPSGRETSEEIDLIEQGFSPRVFSREAGPTTLNRRG